MALAAVAALAGCLPDYAPRSSSDPDEGSQTTAADPLPAGDVLDVHCNADLTLTVSSDEVAASPSGVALRVTSDAPAGAYLHYGIGGDEMPGGEATWVLGIAPGELPLSCSTLDAEGATTVVTVVDPDGHWSDATLEDFGCPPGPIPSWAVPPGTGATPEDAVDALMGAFSGTDTGDELSRAERATVGYPDAANQTWIIGTESITWATAMVMAQGSGYVAYPDLLCQQSSWPDESGA